MLGGPQEDSPRCCELLRQLIHLECLTCLGMQATLAVRNIPQSAVRGDSYAFSVRWQGPGFQPNWLAHGVPDRPGVLGCAGWRVTDPEALAQMDIPGGETVVEIPDRMIQFFRQEGRDAGNG